MTLQPDGSAGPGLAKEFSYNADNTVLTLTLKDGVTFTDGSKLDADTGQGKPRPPVAIPP